MINGTKTEQSVGSYKKYTGLDAFKIVKINPTTEEYKEITGRERELNYNSVGEEGLKPLRFLVSSSNVGFQMLDILINNEFITSQSSGSGVFMSALGKTTWAESMEAITNNPKMEWFGKPVKQLKIGEDTLHELLKALSSYDDRVEGANWVHDLQSAGYDFEKIYNGDVSVLQKFINFYESKYVIIPVGIKETDQGNYTNLITKGNKFYSSWEDQVSDYINDNYDKYLKLQQEAGYAINGINQAKLTEFKKEEIPANNGEDYKTDF